MAMESASDFYADRALLEWQIELGVTEAIGDVPVDRYALPEAGPKKRKAVAEAGPVNVEPAPELDPVQVAQAVAQAAGSLDALQQALGSFELCDLKKGARSLVFADGVAGARVMIIGEAPDRMKIARAAPLLDAPGGCLTKCWPR